MPHWIGKKTFSIFLPKEVICFHVQDTTNIAYTFFRYSFWKAHGTSSSKLLETSGIYPRLIIEKSWKIISITVMTLRSRNLVTNKAWTINLRRSATLFLRYWVSTLCRVCKKCPPLFLLQVCNIIFKIEKWPISKLNFSALKAQITEEFLVFLV